MIAGKPGRGSDQFPLRLPDGMRDRIKAAADANGRSMNAEIVATLEARYPSPESFDQKVERMIYSLGNRIRSADTPERRRIEIDAFSEALRAAGYDEQNVRYWVARVDVK